MKRNLEKWKKMRGNVKQDTVEGVENEGRSHWLSALIMLEHANKFRPLSLLSGRKK